MYPQLLLLPNSHLGRSTHAPWLTSLLHPNMAGYCSPDNLVTDASGLPIFRGGAEITAET